MSTLTSYISGFILSVVLTLAAFSLVLRHTGMQSALLSDSALRLTLALLAILQLFVQLYFFLHLSKKQKAHWQGVVLAFALFIITVVVGGTLWIMSNVRHNAMHATPYINNAITVQNSND